jgi:hypothetical protein
MAIQLTEALLTLAEATRLVPRHRGRKAHISSLYRWSKAGCRGVVLETIQCGATRCTSVEAMQRFFERLTDGATGGLNNDTRQPDINDVEAELDRLRL